MLRCCHFVPSRLAFGFAVRSIVPVHGSVPWQFHSIAIRSATAVAASYSFGPFADDLNCSLRFGSSCSWLAIVDDVAVMLTSLSWVIEDLLQRCAAFVALMDDTRTHNPCSYFA